MNGLDTQRIANTRKKAGGLAGVGTQPLAAGCGETSEMTSRTNCRIDIRGCFAGAFRNWRQKHNIPLKRVAMELGVSIATVQSWESGQRFPTGRHFEMIAEYTGVPPCRLFCVMSDKCIPTECLLAAPKK